MPKIAICRVELTPSAKSDLEAFCERAGTTQVSVMSRTVDWFANQSEMVQAAVLGQFPKAIEADLVKLILKKMSEGQRQEDVGTRNRASARQAG